MRSLESLECATDGPRPAQAQTSRNVRVQDFLVSLQLAFRDAQRARLFPAERSPLSPVSCKAELGATDPLSGLARFLTSRARTRLFI